MRTRRIPRAGRVAIVLVCALVALAAIAQLVLPGIAADRIRSRVGRYGSVERVGVSAWPAVKLLWGHADSITVRARNLRLTPAQSAKLLWEARGAARIDLSAAQLYEGPLRLHAARLTKRGAALSAEAQTTAADVHAALPPGFDVQLVRSGGGSVTVRASGGLFGIGTAIDAEASPSSGRLVARPLVPLLGGLGGIGLTLFSDPHVYVESVAASRRDGASPGYRLAMAARLR